MANIVLPKKYKSKLDVYQTQDAIELIKRTFEKNLSNALNLKRVSAPLFVDPNSGINDNLNGFERPVKFDIPSIKQDAEVVHSLAKWKRVALMKYDFHMHKGLYTDMNAIRRDEVLDNLHSIYVDQWDWELVIANKDRNYEFLKSVVNKIYRSIVDTNKVLQKKYPNLKTKLAKDVYFITSSDLLKTYPKLNSKKREYEIVKKYKTVFISQIGMKLSNGKPHDSRSPDYDDWNLNGDLLIYDELLDTALEISSMGIRVNKDSLLKQLKESKHLERKKLEYHKMLLNNKLPLTIGGGIGQSRLCMLLMEKVHIGEVQSSLWNKDDIIKLKKHNINLL